MASGLKAWVIYLFIHLNKENLQHLQISKQSGESQRSTANMEVGPVAQNGGTSGKNGDTDHPSWHDHQNGTPFDRKKFHSVDIG